jgi:hypothetical protein
LTASKLIVCDLDARLHLDAWRRVLDREEPDYRT